MTFPLLYHAHHSRHLEDLPFWQALAALRPGPILELGCGTGRVLLPLAEQGHPVFGFDREAGMLAVLRKNLHARPALPVWFWQGDMENFRLGRQFGLILLPCNTLSALDPDVRRATLRNTAAHLLPGGLFAASLPNPARLGRLPASSPPELEETFSHPLDGGPVHVFSAWERHKDHFCVNWRYDHRRPDGSREEISARVEHRLDSFAVYQEEFLQAGFTKIETFGDFNRSLYHASSPNLILVAGREPAESTLRRRPKIHRRLR